MVETIQTQSAQLFEAPNPQTVVLKGRKSTDSSYYTGITIEVYDNDRLVDTIVPPNDAGFVPEVKFFSFFGDYCQIFYAADTGGSGGYGNYYVFRVDAERTETIFDMARFSASVSYSGRFEDSYTAVIRNENDGTEYYASLEGKDPSFLKRIFDDHGTPIQQPLIVVNDVSTVFPYYNHTQGIYQLSVYRSVTAIAEVYAFGYVVDYLTWSDGKFQPYLENFATR